MTTRLYFMDTLILLLLSFAFGFYYFENSYAMLIGLLVSISFHALCYYFEQDRITISFYLIHLVLSIIFFPFLFFHTLIVYNLAITNYRKYLFLSFVPLLFHWPNISFLTLLLIFVLDCLAVYISYHTFHTNHLHEEQIQFRDESVEQKLSLEKKNEELMEKQDYEIHMATLKERNRIAREIHDNVGHMLSRSLLQVGAMTALSKDKTQQEVLTELKDTLSIAMTNIRESVHDLHADSLDLYNEIEDLVNHFTFCPIHYEYNISSELPRKYKYSMIAIIKEGLSNIIKHSDATQCSITLIEHPSLYQILIRDNGTINQKVTSENGLGLRNISDRVENMNGTLHLSSENGYRIFISIPKPKQEATTI